MLPVSMMMMAMMMRVCVRCMAGLFDKGYDAIGQGTCQKVNMESWACSRARRFGACHNLYVCFLFCMGIQYVACIDVSKACTRRYA